MPAPPPINPQNMSGDDNPYDFITNPGGQQQKKFKLLPSGNSKMSKILVIVGALIIAIILFVIVSSILGSGDKAQKEQLKDVVYKQKELIRIADIGIQKSRSSEAKNIAMTTKITLTSEQGDLQGALTTLGVKSDAKTIGGPDKKKDQILTTAEQANNFDAVFLEMIRADLISYAKATQIAYKNNTSKKTKSALEAQFNNAATLAGLNDQEKAQ